MVWCPQILNKRGCKVTIVALVWNDIQHFLFYVDQDKHVCDSSQLILFPHILREFLLLLRLGFAPWAVSPDVDLCGVFKQCQKKPEAYYKGLPSTITISLYLKSRGGNQATPIAFRNWLLWYFRRSMLPLQLWIHFSKSLEISHGEDRDKRESDLFIFCSVRAWRCRTLTWVFISIRNWFCNYVFTRFPPPAGICFQG